MHCTNMAGGEQHDQDTEPASLNDGVRESLLENLSDGVYFVDRNRRIMYWNRGAERIAGFTPDEVLGQRCADGLLEHCDESGRILCGERCPLLATINDGRQREVHVYLQHKDGHRKPVRICASPIRDASGAIVGAIESFNEEIGFGHSRQPAAHSTNAFTIDPLTGVENRPTGETVLSDWIAQYQRSGHRFGLLFANVDSFDTMGERYGPKIGDDALTIVARTFVDNTRHNDHVIRWSEADFIILLAEADGTTLETTAERFRMLVTRSGLVADHRHIDLSISIGGTLVTPGDDPARIIQRTSTLLRQSTSGGRNRVTLYAV